MRKAAEGGDTGPRLSPGILVEDLVAAYPALIGPLLRRGVVCMVCGEPYWGTLEELARSKGITDVEGLLRDLEADLEREADVTAEADPEPDACPVPNAGPTAGAGPQSEARRNSEADSAEPEVR